MSKKKFIFDFDSTFVKVESLDFLADHALKDSADKDKIVAEIEEITKLAMEGKMEYFSSIKKRLSALNINKQHIHEFTTILKKQVSESIKSYKSFFKQYKEDIYIVSGGFMELILPVVKPYGILPENVYANTFLFDYNNKVVGFDETNVLSQEEGKAILLTDLDLKGDVVVVGDGYNDYYIKKNGKATRFYAFSENVRREEVVKVADKEVKNMHDFMRLEGLSEKIKQDEKLKVLLLEKINQAAVDKFLENDFEVEVIPKSLSEEDLINKIQDVNILGIRSKTNITEKILKNADNLMAVGAFGIGVNQVDLNACLESGIAVFNAPYSSTRSVVELALGNMIMLVRKVFEKSYALHNGKWEKSYIGANEIRGKKLGIIGYGNIGSQLSILAESIGCQVYYYDKADRMPLGNAKSCASLEELLATSDIISLHIDASKLNKKIIGEREINLMKPGSVFLNLSRGSLVDLDSLYKALESGRIKGAALDVYPEEPKVSNTEFKTPLAKLPNVILTPHIGGSTEEAQSSIGDFVSTNLVDYSNYGNTSGSVNFPNLRLPELKPNHTRVIHIHHNVPGILADINKVFASNEVNVVSQHLQTQGRLGYAVSDIPTNVHEEFLSKLQKVKHTIKLRVIHPD